MAKGDLLELLWHGNPRTARQLRQYTVVQSVSAALLCLVAAATLAAAVQDGSGPRLALALFVALAALANVAYARAMVGRARRQLRAEA